MLSDSGHSLFRTHQKRNRRFTLVEMLVVIAILGILAALLTPALASAYASANRASCLNNMRSVGMGFEVYCSVYNGYLPKPFGKMPWGGSRSWHSLVFPQLMSDITGQENVSGLDAKANMYCPAIPNRKAYCRQTTYGMNAYLGADQWWGGAIPAHVHVRRSRIMRAGEVFILGEKGVNTGWGYSINKTAFTEYELKLSANDVVSVNTRIEPWHLGGANFLYLDGHAAFSLGGNIPLFEAIAMGRDVPEANYSGTYY